MKCMCPSSVERVMKGFMSDWREAFVISGRYGMGDPLARSSTMLKKAV
jgi:hypothetical protein